MRLVAFVIFLLLPWTALAQSDPSALTLVNSEGSPSAATKADSSANELNTIDLHRYVKKPKRSRVKKWREPAGAKDDQAPNEGAGSDNNGADSDLQNAQVAPLPRLTGDTESISNQAAPQPAPQSESAQNPSLGNRMRDIFLGGDPEMIDKYRSFLDSEDIRKNIFEFTLATTYLYDTSLSPYFFRNYIDAAPGGLVGLDLWVTPFFAIDADYKTTFLDSIKDSPTQDTYVSANHTWFDIGVKFRRFFGMAVNAPSLTVGLKYSDYTFAIPLSSQSRLKQYTEGPDISLEAAIPSTKNYMWTMGLNLEPYMNHTEITGSLDLRAGQSNRTVGYGVSAGGEYRMSRQTRAFFKLSTLVYKTQFSGPANATDPVTGSVPSNVPVNNIFYMIDLGVKLGR